VCALVLEHYLSLTKEIDMATDMKQGIRGAVLRMGGVASLVTVLAAAALVQGCGGSSSGYISSRWTLSENGQRVACDPDDEVDIRVDTDQMIKTVSCTDGQVVTPPVSCGVSHSVSLQLYDKNGTLLSSAAPMNIFVPCGVTQPTPDVVFEIGGGACADGAISTSWVLTENNQPVTCAPGDEVDLRVDTDAMTKTFPCSDLQGVSPAVTGGVSHNVSLKLFDKDGNVLSQTGTMALFVPCGTTQPTPKVTFSLTP
jgi:hypothetical protein